MLWWYVLPLTVTEIYTMTSFGRARNMDSTAVNSSREDALWSSCLRCGKLMTWYIVGSEGRESSLDDATRIMHYFTLIYNQAVLWKRTLCPRFWLHQYAGRLVAQCKLQRPRHPPQIPAHQRPVRPPALADDAQLLGLGPLGEAQ